FATWIMGLYSYTGIIDNRIHICGKHANVSGLKWRDAYDRIIVVFMLLFRAGNASPQGLLTIKVKVVMGHCILVPTSEDCKFLFGQCFGGYLFLHPGGIIFINNNLLCENRGV